MVEYIKSAGYIPVRLNAKRPDKPGVEEKKSRRSVRGFATERRARMMLSCRSVTDREARGLSWGIPPFVVVLGCWIRYNKINDVSVCSYQQHIYFCGGDEQHG